MRKSDPLRGGVLAFLTLRQPYGKPPSHGCPTTWGLHYLFNSTNPSLPHLLPPSVKPVQLLSGFTDTAGKSLWRQLCRRCMKQKEDRVAWAAPWTWCVWNAPEKESRISPLLRGGHFCCSSLCVTQSLLVCSGSGVRSSDWTWIPPLSTTLLNPSYQCLSSQGTLGACLQMNGDDTTYLHLLV